MLQRLNVRIGYGPGDKVRFRWELPPVLASEEKYGQYELKMLRYRAGHVDLDPAPYKRIPAKVVDLLVAQAVTPKAMGFVARRLLEDYGEKVTVENRRKAFKRLKGAWIRVGVPDRLRNVPEGYWSTDRVGRSASIPILLFLEDDGRVGASFGLQRTEPSLNLTPT